MQTFAFLFISLFLSSFSGEVKYKLFSAVSVADDKAYLLDYFQETTHDLQQSISGLSKAQLHYKPAADRWSVSQCLEHIILTEKMLFELSKEQMEKPANPERREEVTLTNAQLITGMKDRSYKVKASEALQGEGSYDDPDIALRDFKYQRDLILTYIQGTPVDSMRNRISDSPFGPVDVYQSFLFIAGHVARHTLQIEEIKESEGFPVE